MQTSKPRNGSSDVPQRTSPTTPKSARVIKMGDSESDSTTSKSTPAKAPTDRSPKVPARRSPRSPVTEKKRPSRVAELESQLTQLQDELKKAKDQLGASESWKQRAQQEAEETKKQLSAISSKFEDSQCQLVEFSVAEEARLQELRKISQERDRAWQSELEAIQKQHSVDSAALTTAMSEVHRLKQQLEMVVKSEATQLKQAEKAHSEFEVLQQDMAGTLSIVENLKVHLRRSEKAEAEAQAMIHDTQQQLEISKATVEALRADGLKLMDSFSSKSSELKESRTLVNSLEETVKKLQANQHTVDHKVLPGHQEEKIVHDSLELEVEQLRSALEDVEIKYQEEQIRNTMQIRLAYESAEHAKADLESALKSAKAEIFELRASLVDKETELQSISNMHKELSSEIAKRQVNQMEAELESKLMKSMADTEEVKANLMDIETEMQSISEENELLKSEIRKRDTGDWMTYEEARAELALARAAEQDGLMRLGCATEEADRSGRMAARVAEQLEAAQVVNSEMEAELRRLRVQSDQWRKAAEAAAAALTPTNGRFVERTCSVGSEYHSVSGKLMSSPFSDDMDDESPKKKNNSVMRMIGGLWKKSPK